MYFVTNRVLMRGDVFTLVASAKTAAAEAARREQAAKAMLQEERAGRRRHLHQAALRVIEEQDNFASGAIPLMMSVVILDDLIARVEVARLGQDADGDADNDALIHVNASFGGLSYTVHGLAADFYEHSVSEYRGTALGPFQMVSKADLDLIAWETKNCRLRLYAREEQQRRKGVGPYKSTTIDEHYLGTQQDKDRLIDFRDSQLLMSLKRNGWPTTLKKSYLGIDGRRKYVMVYTHIVRNGTDAVVLEGSCVPPLVVRTYGEKWRVISTWNTGWAAETALREKHTELDVEPLWESTSFRNASNILFVAVRDEPQIVRLFLPFGNVSALIGAQDGRCQLEDEFQHDRWSSSNPGAGKGERPRHPAVAFGRYSR